MRQWIRSHLTYANAMVTILAFIVLGGTATAITYVVSSNSQIGPGTISGHKPPSGKHANIIANSINGQDIADRSGVDTCPSPLTAKFGPICAGSDGVNRTWDSAASYCAGHGLRLPTLTEAMSLGQNYDVPGVGNTSIFWTDEESISDAHIYSEGVSEAGTKEFLDEQDIQQTVCVTDPSA